LKKIISVFSICGILSNVNAQGWSESFNVDATIVNYSLTSDMTWEWWGWGTAEVANGSLTLIGGPSLLNPDINSCWLQIDQSFDPNAVITPDSVTIYLKVKFTTTGTPTIGDQLHVTVALDPVYFSNGNGYVVASSPVGSIGNWYFQDDGPTLVPASAIGYDSWFWEKIVVNSDTISVWVFADGEAPTDTANYTFTPDGVDLGTAAPTFLIIGLTDDDSSAVHIDEVWYNETPAGMDIYDDAPIASSYELGQNYPNPFNPITTLRYDLPETGLVNITIYDILGRQIKTLINQNQDAGFKSVIWDATNDYGKPVSAGVYLYQIRAGNFVQSRKMVLLK
jgi:hypothetical protein